MVQDEAGRKGYGGCGVTESHRASGKLKREVNHRRKLKAGLKLKQKGGENMEDEYSILLKSLNVAVGEVQTRKILEQFKAVAIENHLDYSRRLLHDFLRVAELELNLHHLHNK